MLRWANKRSPFFRCVQVGAGGRPSQSFVSPFASKANAITDTRVKLSSSKASRNHTNASVSQSKLLRQSAHDVGDAEVSVQDACSQDVHVNFCTSDIKSSHNAKSQSADGDAKVSGFAIRMRQAEVQVSSSDVRGAETVKSSCETQSLHVLKKIQKDTQKAQKVPVDLQQKIMLLQSEQFSPSDVTRLLEAWGYKSCSVEQLSTTLQELKKLFPCAKVVHDIVVRSYNVLVQPAENVQQKLKLLHDFQVDEKVVSRLCSSGRVLAVNMESLQQRLMFYNDIGLTVAARNTMFWKAPLILTLNVEKSIQPPLKFLESKGLTKESILRMAHRCPHIFYMSLDKLMKKFEYIRQLGFSVNKLPTVLFTQRLSHENIEEHLHTLRVLGFTDDDVHSMLKSQPAILGLSSENLKGKVDFLINKQHRKLAEIVRYPTCLLYSLQARMVPRFNVLNGLGRSKTCSMSYILTPSDSFFADRFKNARGLQNGLGSAGNLSHENVKD